MRVFIAGATGVLGLALVPLLAAQGHTVGVLARTPARLTRFAAAGVTVVPGDLLAPDMPHRLPGILSGWDVTVHAATAIPRDPSAPGAWDSNTRLRTEGTRRLLSAARAAGVRGYIQQSIVMAYPDGGDAWQDEATPLDTDPDRAAIVAPVATMEAAVRAVDPATLRWSILRGGLFVGPGTAQDALVARHRAGTATVPGDGSAYLSPVHVADMAAAVVATVERLPAGATLNITAAPLPWGDYYDGIAASLGLSPPPRDPSRAASPSHRATNAAARALLNWTPRRDIFPTTFVTPTSGIPMSGQ